MIGMKKVFLDTNFLMDLGRFRIELDEIEDLVTKPYCLLIPSPAVDELNRLAARNKNAKVALKLIEMKGIKILDCKEKDTDRAILALADKDSIVATNDAGLRKSLKRLDVKTIYLRKRKYLVIT